MEIRKAGEGSHDFASACRLYNDSFDRMSAMPIGWIAEMVSKDTDYAAYVAGGPGVDGFAFVYKGDYWLLDYMAVRPERRLRGIATALVERVLEKASRAGAGGLLAETAVPQVMAITRGLGFGTVPGKYFVPMWTRGGYKPHTLVCRPLGSHTWERLEAGIRGVWANPLCKGHGRGGH